MEPMFYCLRLFYEFDVKQILEEGLWSFEQRLVVINNFNLGMVPRTVRMFEVDFWIQVYDLQACF